jgi:hypothetical protein
MFILPIMILDICVIGLSRNACSSSHHVLPLLLLFLTLPIEAKEGTTILVTPTEAVLLLFKPARQQCQQIETNVSL